MLGEGYLKKRIAEHQILEGCNRVCGLMDIIVDILVSEGVGWGSP